MEVIISPTTCPETNLATEKELLVEYRGEAILFLYINAPSVIVGRNQLPEAEADLAYCESCQIPVIKRLSGGGTVYHDEGNINYSFIADAEKGKALDRDFGQPIVDALRSFGIEATVGARKEILVGGKKISGTASHVSRGRQLFHGTLLFDTDLEKMRRALNGIPSLRGKHVASVPSEVANIAGLLAQKITAPQFMERLAVFFEGYFNTPSR
ncbi:lipoate--protein ligase family protein [Alistipes sp. OttesenSCG-928-L06]|nr:lipoate--protein ligase family protein [Alistipes sp. OttesenSCG-928-L06]